MTDKTMLSSIAQEIQLAEAPQTNVSTLNPAPDDLACGVQVRKRCRSIEHTTSPLHSSSEYSQDLADYYCPQRHVFHQSRTQRLSFDLMANKRKSCGDTTNKNTATDGIDMGLVARFWRYSIRITHFHGLPDWLKDNEHLHTSHRLPISTVLGCVRSAFTLHTETFNIWTHALGCLAMLLVAFGFLTRPDTEIQSQEKMVFSFFFVGAIVCMGMSTAYHTLSCHNTLADTFAKLDYVGISLFIACSFVPWLFYGFYCRPEPKLIYTIMIMGFSAVTIFFSLSAKFSHADYKPLRAAVFSATALSGIIPITHFLIVDGWEPLVEKAAFYWMFLVGSLYFAGATLYSVRFPECWFPGKFDIYLHSHQIFHLFVIAGAFVHYYGICQMADNRLADTCAIH